MRNLKQVTALMVSAIAVVLGCGTVFAQQPPGFGGMDFQNMDPQQMMKMMQQRINESFREQMVVTNDSEWRLIEERITAVTKARTAMMSDGGGMMGMGGMRGGRGGGPGGGGFASLFGQPSPEAEALQKAIDDNAPAAQVKILLAKFKEARKAKQAALTKAQDELRSVLTVRQEAIAVLGGLLN